MIHSSKFNVLIQVELKPFAISFLIKLGFSFRLKMVNQSVADQFCRRTLLYRPRTASWISNLQICSPAFTTY